MSFCQNHLQTIGFDTHLVCKERFDIDEISPRQRVLEGLDARVRVARLLTDIRGLKNRMSDFSVKIARASNLQVDPLLGDGLDGLEVHAVRQHQLLVHRPVGVEDDHHVGQRVVALLL